MAASAPSARPYSVVNSGSNGLAELAEALRPGVVTSLQELAKLDAEKAVLVAARSSTPGKRDVEHLVGFVERGGVLVAYGDAAYLLALAERLGSNLSLRGRVYDAVFNAGTRSIVRVEVNSSFCGEAVFLRSPYAVQAGSAGSRAAPAAFSSFLSYLDQDGNGFYDLGEFIGSSPVGLEVALGRGLALLFFAEGFLENGLIEYNEGFLSCLAGARSVFLDQSELSGDPFEYPKLLLRSPSAQIYVLALAAFLAAVSYYVRRD